MSEELLSSKLGPVVFKIALEQAKFADIFSLLKKFFRRLPSNESGQEASSLEVGNALVDSGLIASAGLKRFSETYKDAKRTNFREFVEFMVSEYTIEQVARESGELKLQNEASVQVKENLISEELQRQLAPLAFRISARSGEISRIFGLFQEMFTIFDVNKNGFIQRTEMDKLVEASLLTPDELKIFDQEPGSGTQISFTQFLGLWLNKYVDDDVQQEEILKSKLGPIVFKIALAQQTIKDCFGLLRKIFNVLDESDSGLVQKSDVSCMGFVSRERLGAWSTETPGSLTFIEFGAFYAAELAQEESKDDTEEKNRADISISQDVAEKLAPHIVRLSARSDELKRIFGLFRNMFDVFDEDQDGQINKKELFQLKEADFLKQNEIDELSENPLKFSDFMAFWCTHYLGEVAMEEEKQRARELTDKEKELFPRLFRLDCQRQNVTKIFQLLKEIFNIIEDENKTGFVLKSEVMKMVKRGFLEGAGLPTLNEFKCEQKNYLTFGEFLLWIAESQTT